MFPEDGALPIPGTFLKNAKVFYRMPKTLDILLGLNLGPQWKPTSLLSLFSWQLTLIFLIGGDGHVCTGFCAV